MLDVICSKRLYLHLLISSAKSIVQNTCFSQKTGGMATTPNSGPWMSLASIPPKDFRRDSYSYPLYDHHKHTLYLIHGTRGILKYSFGKDLWNKFLPSVNLYSLEFFQAMTSILTIDKDQTIYLGGYNKQKISQPHGYLATLNIKLDSLKGKPFLNSPKWQLNDKICNHPFRGAKAIMVNDELHVIGGYNGYIHLIYDKDAKEFEKLHDVEFCYSLLIKINDKLLSFGGFYNDGYVDDIWEYDQNKWTKCNEIIPKKMRVYGAASVLNHQFVLIFGGWDGKEFIDNIWIYSVEDKDFTESKIKCPEEKPGHVIAMYYQDMDELSVAGYVRSECRTRLDLIPSKDVMNLIQAHYSTEWIHLFKTGPFDGGKHWRINAFDIINNVENNIQC